MVNVDLSFDEPRVEGKVVTFDLRVRLKTDREVDGEFLWPLVLRFPRASEQEMSQPNASLLPRALALLRVQMDSFLRETEKMEIHCAQEVDRWHSALAREDYREFFGVPQKTSDKPSG